MFTPVRELFAGVPESRARAIRQDVSALTFAADAARPVRRRRDQSGDALPAGHLRTVRQCKGKRYNRETLEIKYKGKTSTKCWI